MKTTWDYTDLAESYLKRPDYSRDAINMMYEVSGLSASGHVCDIGAGVAHLTLHHAEKGCKVTAIEPNDDMRRLGMKRTKHYANVSWYEAVAEDTKQPSIIFDITTFGSSFNVTDRPLALKETARILKSRCWFACMWNHRDLSDPIQDGIESIIKLHIPDYQYGTRREDQTDVINQSRLFSEVKKLEARVVHRQSSEECLKAWHSHVTLRNQAGNNFAEVIRDIATYLEDINVELIDIPYITRIWMAQKRL